jgi:hypothetical protein
MALRKFHEKAKHMPVRGAEIQAVYSMIKHLPLPGAQHVLYSVGYIGAGINMQHNDITHI